MPPSEILGRVTPQTNYISPVTHNSEAFSDRKEKVVTQQLNSSIAIYVQAKNTVAVSVPLNTLRPLVGAVLKNLSPSQQCSPISLRTNAAGHHISNGYGPHHNGNITA